MSFSLPLSTLSTRPSLMRSLTSYCLSVCHCQHCSHDHHWCVPPHLIVFQFAIVNTVHTTIIDAFPHILLSFSLPLSTLSTRPSLMRSPTSYCLSVCHCQHCPHDHHWCVPTHLIVFQFAIVNTVHTTIIDAFPHILLSFSLPLSTLSTRPSLMRSPTSYCLSVCHCQHCTHDHHWCVPTHLIIFQFAIVNTVHTTIIDAFPHILLSFSLPLSTLFTRPSLMRSPTSYCLSVCHCQHCPHDHHWCVPHILLSFSLPLSTLYTRPSLMRSPTSYCLSVCHCQHCTHDHHWCVPHTSYCLSVCHCQHCTHDHHWCVPHTSYCLSVDNGKLKDNKMWGNASMMVVWTVLTMANWKTIRCEGTHQWWSCGQCWQWQTERQ